MARFTYVDFDDWVALYKDGEKVSEGHSLNIRDLFIELDADVEVIYVEYDTPLGEYIESNGRPPETVLEVQELLEE